MLSEKSKIWLGFGGCGAIPLFWQSLAAPFPSSPKKKAKGSKAAFLFGGYVISAWFCSGHSLRSKAAGPQPAASSQGKQRW